MAHRNFVSFSAYSHFIEIYIKSNIWNLISITLRVDNANNLCQSEKRNID